MFSVDPLLIASTVLAWQSAQPAGEREPLIERLDPQTRARVILALAALVMLGALMMAMTWLVFRIIRGRIRDARLVAEKQRRRTVDADDWAKKRLVPRSGEAIDET
jgi:hypothetical protein